MKKRFNFGKHPVNTDKIDNMITVDMELRETDKGPVLSVSAEVWNRMHTDIIMGGQCLDSIHQYLRGDRLFLQIYRLWKKYHLNDMHAGTPKQEAYLDLVGRTNDYAKDYETLRRVGLNKHVRGVKKNGKWTTEKVDYGKKWVYWEIPKDDLELIKELLKD